MMKFIRNTHAFAFLQGLYERLRYGDGMGRTHPTDHDWNESYDRGMDMAERILG